MLISSHQLGELEALCERYVYIDKGELADAFEGQGAPSVLVEVNSRADRETLATYLSDTVRLDDNVLEISTLATPQELNAVLAYLASQNLISGLTVKENQLKEIFSRGE